MRKMIPGIIAFSIIEIVDLSVWINVLGLLGAAILVVGLFAEHIVSFRTKTGLRFPPAVPLTIVAILETGVWIGAFLLTDTHIALSFGLLFVGLSIGHAFELNMVNQLPIRTALRKRLKETLDITAIEAVGGEVWFVLVARGEHIAAAIVLSIIIIVEHFVSFRRVIRK